MPDDTRTPRWPPPTSPPPPPPLPPEVQRVMRPPLPSNPPAPIQREPKRPRRRTPAERWFFAAALVSAVLLVFFAGNQQGRSPYEGRTLGYEVSGEARQATAIQYATNDDSATVTNAALPWSTSFTASRRAQFFLSGGAPGTVSCRITVDGVEVAHQTSRGGVCSIVTPG